MSQNQYDALMGAIQSLTSTAYSYGGRFDSIDGRFDRIDGRLDNIEGRIDGVEGRLDNIEGELKKIEHATQYNANRDIMAKLPFAKVNSHK